jgi:hypothetical protein
LLLFKKLLLLGSTDGAGAGTGAALYTEVGIDLELAITLGDSANGTFCCASAACDASISDFESHFEYLLEYCAVCLLYCVQYKNASA